MELDTQLVLSKYIDPVMAVNAEYKVIFANEAAIQFWGPIEDRKCYEFVYNRAARCPLCVKHDLEASGWAETITRCRFVKSRNGDDVERYVLVAPHVAAISEKSHLETFTAVPNAICGTRAIIRFAEKLEELADVNDILRALVGFLSGDQTSLRCRTRYYSLNSIDHARVLAVTFRDQLKDAHPYIEDIDQRVINRQTGVQFDASFACLDQKRWFILTPEPQKAEAFKVHFRASARDDQVDMWDADPTIVQQPISLYLYRRERDRIITIFKAPRPHTWLDIPICTKRTAYGKISLTLWENSFLFYREHVEELRLIEKFVTRRLAAIESLEEAKTAVALNVIHEVSQPAFAGLASMEALRRRDIENGRTAEDERVDYYLKKNVECSLRMVAFLNDRGRITEDTPSCSDTPTNFLSDVLAPVVNLTRFGIYEKYLRDSGDTADPSELEDIPVSRFRDTGHVKSVFAGILYQVSYGEHCGEVEVYIEKYRLQQVLYNLLNNALKYKGRREDYRVSVQYRPKMTAKETKLFSQYFVIDVTDQGYGVEPGEQETIFGLGVQGKNARRVARVPGSGRGLYVCRAVLRGVGGEILVQNLRSPTVFRILIPRECAYDDWLRKVEAMKETTQDVMRRLKEGEST